LPALQPFKEGNWGGENPFWRRVLAPSPKGGSIAMLKSGFKKALLPKRKK